jgi:hypothetical protein
MFIEALHFFVYSIAIGSGKGYCTAHKILVSITASRVRSSGADLISMYMIQQHIMAQKSNSTQIPQQ